jgi:hypothetical protein
MLKDSMDNSATGPVYWRPGTLYLVYPDSEDTDKGPTEYVMFTTEFDAVNCLSLKGGSGPFVCARVAEPTKGNTRSIHPGLLLVITVTAMIQY